MLLKLHLWILSSSNGTAVWANEIYPAALLLLMKRPVSFHPRLSAYPRIILRSPGFIDCFRTYHLATVSAFHAIFSASQFLAGQPPSRVSDLLAPAVGAVVPVSSQSAMTSLLGDKVQGPTQSRNLGPTTTGESSRPPIRRF